MTPENLTFHVEHDYGYPGVIVLWVMWDVFDHEEHASVFGNRFVFHRNFSEDQLDTVVLDGVKRLMKEWKEVTETSASFIEEAKVEINEKVREEHAKAYKSNPDV